jgi:2-amino-4-hydroxy-6-hydroxymethyldihydropteridine diphosphokinase
MQNLVYIGLGTNLGNLEKNLDEAIKLIVSELNASKLVRSSILETEPWGFESENNFLNMCVGIRTPFHVDACMERLKQIEKKLGRTEKTQDKYVSRIIDLDILFFNADIIEQHDLVVPHPLLHERLFVLQPLSEIAADFIHPVLEKSIKELLAKFNS